VTENLIVSAGLFVAGLSFAWWQIRQPARAQRRATRRGIRHLEHYANHPANHTRKEKP
jgi:hypothetical protein